MLLAYDKFLADPQYLFGGDALGMKRLGTQRARVQLDCFPILRAHLAVVQRTSKLIFIDAALNLREVLQTGQMVILVTFRGRALYDVRLNKSSYL